MISKHLSVWSVLCCLTSLCLISALPSSSPPSLSRREFLDATDPITDVPSTPTFLESPPNGTLATIYPFSDYAQNLTLQIPPNPFISTQGEFRVTLYWMNHLRTLPRDSTSQWVSRLPISLNRIRRRHGDQATDPIPGVRGITWTDLEMDDRVTWSLWPSAMGGRLTYEEVQAALEGTVAVLNQWETPSTPAYSFLLYEGSIELGHGGLRWVGAAS